MKLMNRDVVIAKEIKYMLEKEGFQEGDRIPSERELAEKFGVQRLTLRSSLQILIQEGLIGSRERSGYYVMPERFVIDLNRFRSMTAVLSDRNKVLKNELISFERMETNKKLSEKLELPIGVKIYRFVRVRSVSEAGREEPISLDQSYIPEQIAPRLLKYNLEERSLYEILNTEYGLIPVRASKQVNVVYASDFEVQKLGCSLMQPLVKQSGRVYDNKNRFMEYAESIMLMDKFIFKKLNPIIEGKIGGGSYGL